MRTTLTLDPDVAALVRDAVQRRRSTTKQVVNDALRRALTPSAPERQEPFVTPVHSAKLQPGYDRAGFNRLADEIEDTEIAVGLPGRK